jgi:aminodeoxyfutalosine synthase
MKTLFDEDLISLGKKAFEIKKDKWQDKVFFIKNIHLNYTNICSSHCRFCAFAKDEVDDDAYIFELGNIAEYISSMGDDINEVHIVGGLHPTKPFEYYIEMLQEIRRNFKDIGIKAFSAVEIEFFSRISGLSIENVFKKLRDAGLDMLPGGGAEIFAENVRKQICPEKISGDEWLRIMEIAHGQGIKTNATMLYGHIETYEDRIDHLKKIKELQSRTNGFNAFIPLSFHPENTFLSHKKPSTGVEDLKVIAVSRIILDNIPHIKAYWVMLGEKVAQTALYFGADDLDGTIIKENITHAAGASSKEGLTESELIFLVKSAGMLPVERDTFYNEIRRYS